MKPPRRKRVRLTVQEQRDLYAHHQGNSSMTLKELSAWAQARFGLEKPPGVSTISEFIKRFSSEPALLTDDPAPSAIIASSLIDDDLSTWIEQCARLRLALTGHNIRTKAAKLRDELLLRGELSSDTHAHLASLAFSKGWLFNFQRRRSLKARRMHGEAGSVSATAVEEGRSALQQVISDYNVQDVYNLDETALFYCRAPSSTISSEALPGQKQSKKTHAGGSGDKRRRH